MSSGGTIKTATSTITIFEDVPWVNVSLEASSILATSFSIDFTKGSGDFVAATAFEKGGAASMDSYESDVTADGGTTWNQLQN